ncbi:MAG: ABC transporter permease, partial [Phycisphaerae bacterium]
MDSATQDTALSEALARPRRKSASARARAIGRLARRNILGTLGALLVIVVLFTALFTPLLQRYEDTATFETENLDFNPTANPLEIAANPDKQMGSPFILDRFEGPLSSKHWLGTDQFGRDIYARIIVGTRLAVIIGVGSSLIAVLAGSIIGVISGYFGGLVDLATQRIVDAIQAFPGLVLLMLIVSIMDQPSLALTVAALGFLGFAQSVRIVRSTVLAVSQMTFVEAARSYGASDIRLMIRHVLPNVLASILVIFSISIGLYILAEASLSFLGLGPADKTTWGKMVNAGRFGIEGRSLGPPACGRRGGWRDRRKRA